MNVSNSVPLISTFNAAWNTVDPMAVLSHFTDDAVLTVDPPLPGSPAEYRGREEILKYLQHMGPGFRGLDTSNHSSSDGSLSWDGAFASDELRRQGIKEAAYHAEASLDHGKFSSLSITLDESARKKLQKG